MRIRMHKSAVHIIFKNKCKEQHIYTDSPILESVTYFPMVTYINVNLLYSELDFNWKDRKLQNITAY